MNWLKRLFDQKPVAGVGIYEAWCRSIGLRPAPPAEEVRGSGGNPPSPGNRPGPGLGPPPRSRCVLNLETISTMGYTGSLGLHDTPSQRAARRRAAGLDEAHQAEMDRYGANEKQPLFVCAVRPGLVAEQTPELIAAHHLMATMRRPK